MKLKLKLNVLGEAAVVGVTDVILEKLSPTIMNLGRGAMFATGLILNASTEKYDKETETLYVAATPLLVRSVMNGLGSITDFKHKQQTFNPTFNYTGGTVNLGGWPAAGATTMNNPSTCLTFR